MPSRRRERRLVNLVAVAMTIGIAGSFATMYVAGRWLGEIHGPTDLALVPDGRVAVVSYGHLNGLRPDGTRDEKIALETFGVDDYLADLHFTSDGRLLLGDYRTGRIKVCDLESHSCSGHLLSEGPGRPRGTFKFAVDEQASIIYVTDTGGHRLRVFSLDGEHLMSSRGPAPPLCFPNRVILGDEQDVIVADTNNHRIVAFKRDTREPLDVAWELSMVSREATDTRCEARSESLKDPWLRRELDFDEGASSTPLRGLRWDQKWPAEVKLDPHGRLWVVNAGHNMQHGALLRYESKLSEPQIINLGSSADPVTMLWYGDRMLVADNFGFRVHSVDDDGNVTSFLDETLQSELDRARIKRARYERLRANARNFLIVLGVVAVVAGILYRLTSLFRKGS